MSSPAALCGARRRDFFCCRSAHPGARLSATLAGAVFLPFTMIMGILSRWAGGLLDRFGARLPLILGP